MVPLIFSFFSFFNVKKKIILFETEICMFLEKSMKILFFDFVLRPFGFIKLGPLHLDVS